MPSSTEHHRPHHAQELPERLSFKPQPITQLPGAPPYNQYILLAYPYYLWRPEELEICEGEVGP